jgi:hypothetical protein
MDKVCVAIFIFWTIRLRQLYRHIDPLGDRWRLACVLPFKR